MLMRWNLFRMQRSKLPLVFAKVNRQKKFLKLQFEYSSDRTDQQWKHVAGGKSSCQYKRRQMVIKDFLPPNFSDWITSQEFREIKQQVIRHSSIRNKWIQITQKSVLVHWYSERANLDKQSNQNSNPETQGMLLEHVIS